MKRKFRIIVGMLLLAIPLCMNAQQPSKPKQEPKRDKVERTEKEKLEKEREREREKMGHFARACPYSGFQQFPQHSTASAAPAPYQPPQTQYQSTSQFVA